MASRVLTAKVPAELIDRADALARRRGVTRNRLVREALEAAVDGRVTFLSPKEREAQEIREAMARRDQELRMACRAPSWRPQGSSLR
jgi:predicted DNA-binding protein